VNNFDSISFSHDLVIFDGLFAQIIFTVNVICTCIPLIVIISGLVL